MLTALGFTRAWRFRSRKEVELLLTKEPIQLPKEMHPTRRRTADKPTNPPKPQKAHQLQIRTLRYLAFPPPTNRKFVPIRETGRGEKAGPACRWLTIRLRYRAGGPRFHRRSETSLGLGRRPPTGRQRLVVEGVGSTEVWGAGWG